MQNGIIVHKLYIARAQIHPVTNVRPPRQLKDAFDRGFLQFGQWLAKLLPGGADDLGVEVATQLAAEIAEDRNFVEGQFVQPRRHAFAPQVTFEAAKEDRQKLRETRQYFR